MEDTLWAGNPAPRYALGIADDEIAIRLFDIVSSLAILTFVWPVLLAIALAVGITSSGPVLYRQQRLGRYGKPFTLLKFRTMIDHAEDATGPVLAELNDRRITPVGRILRRLRLDELPQLFNILRGDMSLVGPRPERPFFVQREPCFQGLRLTVKPGLTGLAQIRGSYHLIPYRKVRYDRLYIRNRSVILNMVIVLRTVPAVLKMRGE